MDQFRDIKRMANQIATAFQAYPEDQAVRETANHIKSFWDPRMRKQIVEHTTSNVGEGLSPVAKAGVALLPRA